MLTAIVAILLGNLLIGTLFAPALQELRKILTRFSEIQLPHESFWPHEQMTPQQIHEARQEAARQFNRLFREFTISFAAFRRLAIVFAGAVLALGAVTVWQMPLSTKVKVFAIVVIVAAVTAIGLYLQRAVAPEPGQLVSIDFLQNNFASLHISSLFDCSDLRVSLGRSLNEPIAHLSLTQDLLFFGYRFLLAVSNERRSRIFFVAYGQLDAGVVFQHMWTPDIQTFVIPLGDFSLSDAMLVDPLLSLHFWLFVPTPKSWVPEKKLHPRVLHDDITSELGGQVGIRMSQSKCSWDSVDGAIEFERKSVVGFDSWKITRLTVSNGNSSEAIVRMFRDKIESRTCKIESYDYPNGIAIR